MTAPTGILFQNTIYDCTYRNSVSNFFACALPTQCFSKAVAIDTDTEVPISVTKLLLTPTVSHQASVTLTPRQVKLQCDHVCLEQTLFSHVDSLWQVSKLSLPLQTPQRQLRLLRTKVMLLM